MNEDKDYIEVVVLSDPRYFRQQEVIRMSPKAPLALRVTESHGKFVKTRFGWVLYDGLRRLA
jgi:hypothetical protein